MEKSNTPQAITENAEISRKLWNTPQLKTIDIAGFTRNQPGTGGDGECALATHS